MAYPRRTQQIVATHAAFIRQVVDFVSHGERQQDLQALLERAAQNGWHGLVRCLHMILKGRRDAGVLNGLDEEDRAIAEAVLRGLQDSATLPEPDTAPDASLAAPGLARMIHQAATGDTQALILIGNMAEQMRQVGGDMAQLAGRIRPLVNGERDPQRLCKGMSARGERLVFGILDELARLDLQ